MEAAAAAGVFLVMTADVAITTVVGVVRFVRERRGGPQATPPGDEDAKQQPQATPPGDENAKQQPQGVCYLNETQPPTKPPTKQCPAARQAAQELPRLPPPLPPALPPPLHAVCYANETKRQSRPPLHAVCYANETGRQSRPPLHGPNATAAPLVGRRQGRHDAPGAADQVWGGVGMLVLTVGLGLAAVAVRARRRTRAREAHHTAEVSGQPPQYGAQGRANPGVASLVAVPAAGGSLPGKKHAAAAFRVTTKAQWRRIDLTRPEAMCSAARATLRGASEGMVIAVDDAPRSPSALELIRVAMQVGEMESADGSRQRLAADGALMCTGTPEGAVAQGRLLRHFVRLHLTELPDGPLLHCCFTGLLRACLSQRGEARPGRFGLRSLQHVCAQMSVAFEQLQGSEMKLPARWLAAVSSVTGVPLQGFTRRADAYRTAEGRLTTDDYFVMGSEAGIVRVPDSRTKEKGRLQPRVDSKMLLVDMEQRTFTRDRALKRSIATAPPYSPWVESEKITLKRLVSAVSSPMPQIGVFNEMTDARLRENQRALRRRRRACCNAEERLCTDLALSAADAKRIAGAPCIAAEELGEAALQYGDDRAHLVALLSAAGLYSTETHGLQSSQLAQSAWWVSELRSGVADGAEGTVVTRAVARRKDDAEVAALLWLVWEAQGAGLIVPLTDEEAQVHQCLSISEVPGLHAVVGEEDPKEALHQMSLMKGEDPAEIAHKILPAGFEGHSRLYVAVVRTLGITAVGVALRTADKTGGQCEEEAERAALHLACWLTEGSMFGQRIAQQMLSGMPYQQVDDLSSLPSSCSTAQRSLPPSRGTSPAEGGVLPLPPIGDAGFASGDFCTYALTSEGARSLVSALQAQQDGSEMVGQLIQVIRPRFAFLATHQHASKVLAAVAAAASRPQLADLLSTAAVHLGELVDSNCGSDVVAAWISALPEHADAGPAAPFLVGAMLPVLGPMCTSVNGRKVLQAAAARLGPEEMAPLYDKVCSALADLATDECGCITLQCLFDSATDPRKMRLQLRLTELCPQLISDPYGNYVLQHAVKDVTVSHMVAARMRGNVLKLACDKFASNVMERCLQSGPDRTRVDLVSEVCHPNVLPILMNDAFGNCVVQSCVDYCPNTMVDMVRDTVTPLLARSSYGDRIKTKLRRRLLCSGFEIPL